MSANGFGELPTTPRAHVRAASAQDVGREFRVAEADVTGRASGDDVPRAVEEDQRSLFRCEDLRSLAVNVRQMAVVRLDDVGDCDQLPAFRALDRTKRASGGNPARVREIVQALRWCILRAACTLASWVDALGRRDRGESGFHRCRDPERHRDGPLQLSPSRQPSLDPGRGASRNSSRLATRSCGVGRSALDAAASSA